ncbi:MAG: hydrocarbon-binding protein [Cyanobacteria bacterium P01_D01_bin.50]
MLRSELGDFCSIICFKAAILGMENALGEKATAIALTTAGRSRGKNLAKDLGLTGVRADWDLITDKIGFALGANGTKLCKIEKIVEKGGVIQVSASETLGSAGEFEGSSRKCTFTLGAVWGALEEITGKRLRGTHTESLLRGGNYDIFEFSPLV